MSGIQRFTPKNASIAPIGALRRIGLIVNALTAAPFFELAAEIVRKIERRSRRSLIKKRATRRSREF
jgi:hypothetical protein